MGRRYRRKSNPELFGLALVILLAIYVIQVVLEFINDNLDAIINFILLCVLIVVIYYVIKIVLYIKRNNAYRATKYYQDTNIPLKVIETNKGLRFEFEVFEKLSSTFLEAHVLTNLLIPRKGSINEYSEIDLILIHTSGVYVLELKNYKGYIYGNLKDKYWNVGYKNESNRNVIEFLNPIVQNQKHIDDLSMLINIDFKSYIIFNNTIDLNSKIDNVLFLDTFIEILKSANLKYDMNEMDSIRDRILKVNEFENLDNHIERIKFNDTKYSRSRRYKKN